MDLLDVCLEKIPPTTEQIECSGATHRVTWRSGELVLQDHDIESERAFKALGGDDCECLTLHDAWVSAFQDPAALRMLEPAGDLPLEVVEAQNLTFAQAYQVRVRHSVAVPSGIVEEYRRSRQRLALYRLPPALKDRLMLEMLIRIQREYPEHPHPADVVSGFLQAKVSEAALQCVSSWTRRGEQKIVDAEIWDPGSGHFIAGWVGPTRGYALVGLPWTWLFDVWGRGLAVVDGCLVVEADDESPDQVRVKAVRWERCMLDESPQSSPDAALAVPGRHTDRLTIHYSDRLVPVVESATASMTKDGWVLRWLGSS